jgi:serine/threonine-protein kinase
MGEVHEVERIADGRRLALKVLNGARDRAALARFAREAQIAAQLDHPHLVSVLDVDVSRSGMLFLVMELVPGTTLAAQRERFGEARWAIPILSQVADALAAMHARGIVHRDLKPSNVLVDGDAAKVADFGVASVLDRIAYQETLAPGEIAAQSPELTQTGAIVGTPLYMAPELVHGARDAEPSADVFSFGVMAYELLAKDLPFASPPVMERLAGRLAPTPKPLRAQRPELPVELAALVDRCLADAPVGRPTAKELFAGLSREAVRGAG